MKLATKIFKREDWYVTSKFGYRKHPITGKTTFHNGVDYGTDVQKWAQYAVEDGYVYKVTKSSSGYGNSIWVRYPRINRSLFHAHLDSIKVKEGDKVVEGTLLGYTGTSGSSTGIHLHLGMTEIGKDTWLDAHAYDYQEPSDKYNLTRYLKKNCKGDDVVQLQKELNKLGYKGKDGKTLETKTKIFGDNTAYAVKKYQSAKKLTADSIVGPDTAHKLGWLFQGK